MNKLMIRLIKFYQRLHKGGPKRCRYSPSCSNYGLEAFQKFNFFYAFYLTATRILRCNRLFKPKYDPVPKNRIEILFDDIVLKK